jgi:hypothetical protein
VTIGRPRVRLYLDESGDHSSSDATAIGKRYLGLVGVIFQRDPYQRFVLELEALKRRHLHYDPDEPPVLHRVEILYARGPFRSLQDPAKRTAFDAELLTLIQRTDFRVVAVVLDKVSHLRATYRLLGHPYHYCPLAMLERYCGLLHFRGWEGDLMAEARGRDEDTALKAAYREFHARGRGYLTADRAQATLTSQEAKLKPKRANIAGLQLADVLAHPLTRDVLYAAGIIPTRGGLYADRVAAVIEPKYNRQIYRNQIAGYGRVLL